MTTIPHSMRAVRLDTYGGPDALHIHTLPVPAPSDGELLIRIEAFGVNRSEQHFRKGLGSFGTLPRVPGLEAVGTVCATGSTTAHEWSTGQQVCALMGGMGRLFDGGYAEYVCVPEGIVIPFKSSLDWGLLGAIPEMLQTANDSLTVGTDSHEGDWLLIRGGTSSIGLACIALAASKGIRVIATSRKAERLPLLRDAGAEVALVDDGSIEPAVRAATGGRGVDGAVELVGVNTLRDTLAATRRGGTVCFTGMLSDQWTIPDFYPMDWIPTGVRLTVYSGEAVDLPVYTLQQYLDGIEVGAITPPRIRVYEGLESVWRAHADMDANTGVGKQVVRVVHADSGPSAPSAVSQEAS
ncbi:zinc-binding dehydrogenase [Actinomyces mediterranea]|uniref:zinc-binding dehydrogenase n=1 Tax=Actinomyces mediterranea TaxID=1871028 RepID=UPI000970FA7F|nr:zinc-binding dehydrogenase [Actinomyces mediterranea]